MAAPAEPSPTRKAWVLSVWRKGGENLEIGRRAGVWGAKTPGKLAGIEAGDRLIFVLKLGFKPGTTSSRVDGPKFRLIADRAVLVVYGVAESGLYDDTDPVWPDDVYPHRFRWRETAAQEDVPVVETLAPAVVEGLRLSMVTAGRAYEVPVSSLPPDSAGPLPPTASGTPVERASKGVVTVPAPPTSVPPVAPRPDPPVIVALADPEVDPAADPGHTRAQWQLARMGRSLGMDVWVPRSDRGKDHDGERLGDQSVATLPSMGLTPEALTVVQNIDVLWLHRGVVVAAFEVEHSTAVYSGILRMSDLVVEQPYTPIKLFIVAAERRRDKVARELARPTFAQSNLGRICRFMSYEQLEDRLRFAQEHGRYLKLDWIEGLADPVHAGA